MTSTHKFIHFGCWNKGVCENEATPLAKVMHSLRNYTVIEKPEFIVVAGDNYYPEKVKNKETNEKEKTVIPKNLAAGFSCLPKTVPIDMILGNHDLETNVFIADVNDKDTDCFITKEEVSLAIPNHIDLVVHKARVLDNHTLLLMIDTSMYDDEDIGVLLPCYKKMSGYTDIINKEELRAQQFTFIKDKVTNFNGSNIIIVGHHPITAYKLKKEKIKLIDAFSSFIEALQNIFYLKKNSVNYYYLCADLHLYQEGTINIHTLQGDMLITQYVVGTGGTDLDPDPSTGFKASNSFKTELTDAVGIYNITAEQQKNSVKEFGFLECDFKNPTHLAFKFIKVPINSSGGRQRRTKKKKNKYTKRSYKKTRKNKKKLSKRTKIKHKTYTKTR